ncbi:MAG: YiiD C-terminal domain-containing protein [Bdellovibrio sp.]|nr:YiiD C-terminal domain-containing protein [Bdellovibrio sp.]
MIVKFLRFIAERSPTFVMRLFFNLYPPYFGAGIQVEEISKDRRYLRVKLKLRFYNRNYVGTQFGGSIYSMTDPHFMYLLLNNLGTEYVVWDKGAKIDFVKPGKTHLIAEFKIDDQLLAQIKENTKEGQKYIFDLPVTVFDQDGEAIAQVSKTMYVRLKNRNR